MVIEEVALNYVNDVPITVIGRITISQLINCYPKNGASLMSHEFVIMNNNREIRGVKKLNNLNLKHKI